MTTAVLTHEAVLDAALQEFDGSQAELARSLEVAQSSISRWRAKKSRPEVESALIIARLTGLSRTDVLQAFGHDPLKLGLVDLQGTSPDNGSQLRELGRMLRRFADQVDAMAGRRKPRRSQPDYDPQGLRSLDRPNSNQGAQERRVGVLQFPHLWERRREALAR